MVPVAMKSDSDCHWVVEDCVGETPSFERRIAHSNGSYDLLLDPRVFFFRHTFLKMVNTVKSDDPRIWSDCGVLRLAFLRGARMKRIVYVWRLSFKNFRLENENNPKKSASR